MFLYNVVSTTFGNKSLLYVKIFWCAFKVLAQGIENVNFLIHFVVEDFKVISVLFNFTHWGARKASENFKMGLGLVVQRTLWHLKMYKPRKKWQFVNLEPNWGIDSLIIHMVWNWQEFITSSSILYHVIVYKVYIEMVKTFKSLLMTPWTKTRSVLKLWSLLNPLKQVYFEHLITLSYNYHQDLFNVVSHASIGNDLIHVSWVLVVESQIVSSIFDLFFGHSIPNSQLQKENVNFYLIFYVSRHLKYYIGGSIWIIYIFVPRIWNIPKL
jgi:hypothetical protein